MENKIRVVVIEDHHLLLNAMVKELGNEPDIEVVGQATHGDQLSELVSGTHPDVVVLDLKMSEGNFKPLPVVRKLVQAIPHKLSTLTACQDC